MALCLVIRKDEEKKEENYCVTHHVFGGTSNPTCVYPHLPSLLVPVALNCLVALLAVRHSSSDQLADSFLGFRVEEEF
jgi:hypothetical protein